MLALRSLAKSTLGELKDSLLEIDSDDDDETPSPAKVASTDVAVHGDPAWPQGWLGPSSTSSTSAIAPRSFDVPAPIPARDHDEMRSTSSPQPPQRLERLEKASSVAAPTLAKEGPIVSSQPPKADDGEEMANLSSAAEPQQQVLQNFDSEDPDRRHLLESSRECYDKLLEQYNTLERRYREVSEARAAESELHAQVDAWRSAHKVAQERVEILTLENADLKERIRTLERRGIDPDERKKILERLQQREAELKAASEALRQLQEVIDDGTGDDKARCSRLEAELREARQAVAKAQSENATIARETEEARKIADVAKLAKEEADERCRLIQKETQETVTALDVLLNEKERFMEERRHVVDRRLVTGMLANYIDHLESGQKQLADAALSQMLQILGGLPDKESRQRIRNACAAKESFTQNFLEFLDQETAEVAPAKVEATALVSKKPDLRT